MRLTRLAADRYRSLQSVTVDIDALNVFIGANASGKSNLLDALRFLSTALRDRDFERAVRERGGLLALAWKGEPAADVRLTTSFSHDERLFEWTVTLRTPGRGWEFSVDETVTEKREGQAPVVLLSAEKGVGTWWSQEGGRQVPLAQAGTACALAAAAADASFPAREVAEFVRGWSFFDPNPDLMRRSARLDDDVRLDPFGRNLAARLDALRESSPELLEEILAATKGMLGVPDSIDLRETDDGRVYFVQKEAGLEFPVHQVGTSSGTLRLLALLVGLIGEPESGLVGIEEPENHVHPSALMAFAAEVRRASERLQVLVTTHSPLFVDALDDPAAVVLVRRTSDGTQVTREEQPEAVRRALEESGFALGELHQAKGFGA